MTARKIVTVLLTGLLFFLNCSRTKAQANFYNLYKLGDYKYDTTFFEIPEECDSAAAPFKAVFKKYWTLSRVAFIRPHKFHRHDTIRNGIIRYSATITVYNGSVGPLMLSLQMTKDGRRVFDFYLDGDTAMYANSKIYGDKYENNDFYNFDGHMYDWKPGYFKNYIQFITYYVQHNDEWKQSNSIENKDEMKNLGNNVLYIPDYLTAIMKFHSLRKITVTPDEVLANYKFPCKIVSAKQINKMILDSTAGVYYLTASDITDYIRVVNSATGAVVYSDRKGIFSFIGVKTIAELNKEVLKSQKK